MTNVAFIGLGSMGAPLARLIARGAFALTVYDPFSPALATFDGIARVAGSARDAAAGAEIVCICVRDDEQVRQVIYGDGDGGVVAGIDRGGLVAIHSTVRADTLRTIRDDLGECGITVIDAAVSRTRQTDDDRFVVSIVGGEEAEVQRVRPVLETFSTDVQHVGPAGAGVTAKIANNLVTWVQIVVGAQAAAMAASNGVSVERLRDIMTANGNLTPVIGAMFANRIAAADGVPDPARAAFALSQTGIGRKDLTLAMESLEFGGLDSQLADAARTLVRFALTGSND